MNKKCINKTQIHYLLFNIEHSERNSAPGQEWKVAGKTTKDYAKSVSINI